jgi:uncharacterized protein (DUF2062 family)
MLNNFLESTKQKMAVWLRQGISPRRLALTLALGFAIGCIPVVGVTSALCAVLALALRLNFPAIQAANWIAMPLQVALLLPFARLGRRWFAFGSERAFDAGSLLHSSPWVMLSQMGTVVGQAVLAWLLIAIPAVALITATLTLVLRRFPALTRVAD